MVQGFEPTSRDPFQSLQSLQSNDSPLGNHELPALSGVKKVDPEIAGARE